MRTRDMMRQAKHILRVFDQATDDEVDNGIGWYADARELAAELDPSDVERSAAVIAVLSPRLNWDKNVELARRAYDLHRWTTTDQFQLPCLRANADKAIRILDGENPDEVVSGPKVRAFWHAIVNPSDPRAIVIDRHALDVAFGKVMDDRTRGKILGVKGAYDEVCQRYVFAAEFVSSQLGETITPVQVQAITWVVWRRLKREGKA